MATIKTPVANYSGVVAGVTFVDGVGETADANALIYFARHGYTIESAALPSSLTYETAKDPATMTVAELREYAEDNSIDLTGLTRKDDILDAILLPGAPTGVAGTAGNAQISVAYVAPTDTGPGTISGYQVGVLNLDDEDAEESVHADAASPYVATGLTNGDEYQVRVRAINQYGTGPWSDADTATPTT